MLTMSHPVLVEIHKTRYRDSFGRKGVGLNWLSRNRFRIPQTQVLTYSASRMMAVDAEKGLADILQLLATQIDLQKTYAVRSSANLEDGDGFSFAGQFATVTNVRGLQAIGDAIQRVLASKDSPAIQTYRDKLEDEKQELQMAALVQEMITPVLSGVAFSKNPTTGLDEVVIEAVLGAGEALVQEGVTPQRWIYRWGHFLSQPENEQEFNPVIENVAQETRRIASKYGSPVDLEWVFDGEQVYWLQLRPVTALNDIPLYSNRISREVLPGIIKPLIASINIPLVNTAWVRLFDSLLGPTGLQPQDLTRLFHYRAYFNMAAVGKIFEILGFPRESLEMLLGFENSSGRPTFRPSLRTFRHIPRLLRFMAQAWNYDRRVKPELDTIATKVRELQLEEIRSLRQQELLERIDQLYQFNLSVAYQNILIPILMSIFNAILKMQLKRLKVEFTDFDLTAGLEELREYNPNPFLDEMKNVFERYPLSVQDQISKASYEQIEQIPGIDEFRLAITRFIQKFGHLSESGNDFSKTPWREDPYIVLRMAIQHIPIARAEQKLIWATLPASRFARLRLKPFYMRSRSLRFQREQISSLYTASYGWFRVYFSALARLFHTQGVLQTEQDIYYLTWQEIRALAADPDKTQGFQELILERKEEIAASSDVSLPEIIYGDNAPPLALMKNDMNRLTGIPTSPGYFQGILKVVRSTDGIEKIQPGHVLAIPYSDVAWTPLFAKAGAVIAEAGGMLSHSSIVAREFGIPCVVSVNGACDLPEDCEVMVDGYQGTIQVVRQA